MSPLHEVIDLTPPADVADLPAHLWRVRILRCLAKSHDEGARVVGPCEYCAGTGIDPNRDLATSLICPCFGGLALYVVEECEACDGRGHDGGLVQTNVGSHASLQPEFEEYAGEDCGECFGIGRWPVAEEEQPDAEGRRLLIEARLRRAGFEEDDAVWWKRAGDDRFLWLDRKGGGEIDCAHTQPVTTWITEDGEPGSFHDHPSLASYLGWD